MISVLKSLTRFIYPYNIIHIISHRSQLDNIGYIYNIKKSQLDLNRSHIDLTQIYERSQLNLSQISDKSHPNIKGISDRSQMNLR